MRKLFLASISTIVIILLFFSFQIINAQQTSNEDISLVQLEISIIKPENSTYAEVDVILSYETNIEASSTSYSLDGLENITISNDIILTDLSAGEHQLILFAQDQDGNVVTSDTIIFTIKPYPSMLVVISLTFVGLIGVAFLIKSIKQKD